MEFPFYAYKEQRHTSACVVGSSPFNGLYSESDGALCLRNWLILIEQRCHCNKLIIVSESYCPEDGWKGMQTRTYH